MVRTWATAAALCFRACFALETASFFFLCIENGEGTGMVRLLYTPGPLVPVGKTNRD
jgi:hypothetical protein